MLKSIRFAGISFGLLALFAVSCNEDGSADVREEARQSVSATSTSANAAITAEGATATADAPAAPTGPTTAMTFEETEFEFGTVAEGEKVSHTYVFENTGEEPLLISNAKGSCGCTVPDWPREPIAPGAKGEVTVEFNSSGKPGDRNQKVTLTANTNPAQTFLALKGNVTPKDAASPLVQ